MRARLRHWYWNARERDVLVFIIAGFFGAWLIGAAVCFVLGAGWASLIIGMYVGIAWNLAVAVYNVSQIGKG